MKERKEERRKGRKEGRQEGRKAERQKGRKAERQKGRTEAEIAAAAVAAEVVLREVERLDRGAAALAETAAALQAAKVAADTELAAELAAGQLRAEQSAREEAAARAIVDEQAQHAAADRKAKDEEAGFLFSPFLSIWFAAPTLLRRRTDSNRRAVHRLRRILPDLVGRTGRCISRARSSELAASLKSSPSATSWRRAVGSSEL